MSVRTATRVLGPIPLLASAVLTVVLTRGCSNGPTNKTPACSTDTDCAAMGLRGCLNGTCVECINDTYCPDTAPMCDQATNKCAAHCKTNSDCKNPAYPLCDTRVGDFEFQDCVTCLADTDCKSGFYCDCGQCLKGCKSDSDCSGHDTCDVSGRCAASCAKTCADAMANGGRVCAMAGANSQQSYSMLVACVTANCAAVCPAFVMAEGLDTDQGCTSCVSAHCSTQQASCAGN
jgi:hypothetical protein